MWQHWTEQKGTGLVLVWLFLFTLLPSEPFVLHGFSLCVTLVFFLSFYHEFLDVLSSEKSKTHPKDEIGQCKSINRKR